MILNLINNNAKPKIVVEATVIKACPNCGQKRVDDYGKPSIICNNCGDSSEIINSLGKIYSNDFWWNIKKKIKKFLGEK